MFTAKAIKRSGWKTDLVLDQVCLEQGDFFLQTVELLMQIPAGQQKERDVDVFQSRVCVLGNTQFALRADRFTENTTNKHKDSNFPS